jgi:hypothetical protein
MVCIGHVVNLMVIPSTPKKACGTLKKLSTQYIEVTGAKEANSAPGIFPFWVVVSLTAEYLWSFKSFLTSTTCLSVTDVFYEAKGNCTSLPERGWRHCNNGKGVDPPPQVIVL